MRVQFGQLSKITIWLGDFNLQMWNIQSSIQIRIETQSKKSPVLARLLWEDTPKYPKIPQRIIMGIPLIGHKIRVHPPLLTKPHGPTVSCCTLKFNVFRWSVLNPDAWQNMKLENPEIWSKEQLVHMLETGFCFFFFFKGGVLCNYWLVKNGIPIMIMIISNI